MPRSTLCVLLVGVLLHPPASGYAAGGWGSRQWRKRCSEVRTTYNPDRPLDHDSLTVGVYDPRWEDLVFWAIINGIPHRSVAGPARSRGFGRRGASGIALRWAQGTRWERTVEYSFGYAVGLLVGEHGWRDVQFSEYFAPITGTYDYNLKDRLYLLEPNKPDSWVTFFEYLADSNGLASSYALAQPVMVDVDREKVVYRGGQGVGFEVSYERFLRDLRDVLDDCRAFEFFQAYDVYGQGFASRPGWAQGRASAPAKLAFRAGAVGEPAERVQPPRPVVRGTAVCSQAHAADTYRKQCAVCHGRDGGGDGLMAASLVPPPRDLRRGLFKIRSTPAGSPPADQDLVRVVSRGLPGTAMPGWSQFLDGKEIEEVVRCIKQLSPRFGSEKTSKPLPVKASKRPVEELLANGARQWRQLGCSECHGSDGRGWSSRALEDDWGRPVLPTDLTDKWRFRGGYSPEDVYLRLAAGMDGTPMRPYLGQAREQDLWDLAYYVLSLSPEHRPQVNRRATEMPP